MSDGRTQPARRRRERRAWWARRGERRVAIRGASAKRRDAVLQRAAEQRGAQPPAELRAQPSDPAAAGEVLARKPRAWWARRGERRATTRVASARSRAIRLKQARVAASAELGWLGVASGAQPHAVFQRAATGVASGAQPHAALQRAAELSGAQPHAVLPPSPPPPSSLPPSHEEKRAPPPLPPHQLRPQAEQQPRHRVEWRKYDLERARTLAPSDGRRAGRELGLGAAERAAARRERKLEENRARLPRSRRSQQDLPRWWSPVAPTSAPGTRTHPRSQWRQAARPLRAARAFGRTRPRQAGRVAAGRERQHEAQQAHRPRSCSSRLALPSRRRIRPGRALTHSLDSDGTLLGEELGLSPS